MWFIVLLISQKDYELLIIYEEIIGEVGVCEGGCFC